MLHRHHRDGNFKTLTIFMWSVNKMELSDKYVISVKLYHIMKNKIIHTILCIYIDFKHFNFIFSYMHILPYIFLVYIKLIACTIYKYKIHLNLFCMCTLNNIYKNRILKLRIYSHHCPNKRRLQTIKLKNTYYKRSPF